MNILAVSETPNGGEQLATQALLKALRLQKVAITHSQLHALQNTSSFFYFWWIVSSVFFAFYFALKHRNRQVFYTTTFTALIGGILARPITHQRICFHYHGNRVPVPASADLPKLRQLTQWLKYSVTVKLHRFGWSQTDIFCAPSQIQLEKLHQQYPSLGKAELVLPNGVDHSVFSPVSAVAKKKLRKKYSIPINSLVCLLSGRVEPKKRWQESLKVVQAVKEKLNKEVFLICAYPNHGNDPTYLKQFSDSLKKAQLGYAVFSNPSQISEIYQMSDFLISNSIEEVFPLTLLEAAASQLPYFSTKNGTVENYLSKIDPELILPNSPLKAAEQMICCLRKRNLEKNLRDFAAQYSWKKTASTLKKFLITRY